MLDTDIFCFSEVHPQNFSDFSQILFGFNGFYETDNISTFLNCIYGQSIFVSKKYQVNKIKKLNTYKNLIKDVGFTQIVNLKINNRYLNIGNVHGKTHPGHKLDTPARIKQSQKIINSFNNNSSKIIGGDFNLFNKTKSVEMFEIAGYRNLIKDFKIKDTRGKINRRIYKGKGIQYFADYCFVSPNIKVKSFKVPDIEISDHLPLILEFEV